MIDGVDRAISTSAATADRLVSQDPFVFNGSIRENIALGRPGATLDEVIAAAKAAGYEYIAALPDRYESPVGERASGPSSGSGNGYIARALVAGPRC